MDRSRHMDHSTVRLLKPQVDLNSQWDQAALWVPMHQWVHAVLTYQRVHRDLSTQWDQTDQCIPWDLKDLTFQLDLMDLKDL